MDKFNDAEAVKKQYATSENLAKRISIHDKYSVNKLGFGPWIFSNYEFKSGMKVLELGCGTGDMWIGHEDLITSFDKLVLSDMSQGMLETAKEKVGDSINVEYKVIDIQDIPYEENSFDVVIANMMLYHVPDIDKALKEVRRVLKDGGTFYSATIGENGISNFVAKALSDYDVDGNINRKFTLQNGEEMLKKAFSNIKRNNYEDSLAVTNLDDIVDYIYSLTSMSILADVPRPEIKSVLEKYVTNGVLNIPKEYGMFISK